MEVQIAPDCGNSPKVQLLKEINLAFGNHEVDFLVDMVSDDFRWEMVGKSVIEGKENYRKALVEMKDYPTKVMALHSIITHGKSAAVTGEITLEDGSHYGFCDVYEFTSAGAKVLRTLKSYVIKLD